MTTKTQARNNEASRISKLSAAYRKHQSAIQDALDRRAQVMRSHIPVIVASAPDGTLYRIGCTSGGYRVLSVEQGRQAS